MHESTSGNSIREGAKARAVSAGLALPQIVPAQADEVRSKAGARTARLALALETFLEDRDGADATTLEEPAVPGPTPVR